jgi:hypothetical protein
MTWQDLVYSIGQWVFIVALLPSVFSKNKPAFVSSLTTGTVLLVYVFTMASLNLWVSSASTSITCLVWYILAFQKYRLDKKIKE